MKKFRSLWKTFKAFLISICLLLCLLVTAENAYADNSLSSCPNTTVNNAANDCYTITLPSGLGTGITYDGADSEPVWTDAVSKNIITLGSSSGSIKVFRENDNTLYLFIRVTDNSLSNSDNILLFIDPLHNHSTTSDDIVFRFRRSTTLSAEKSIGSGSLSNWLTPGTIAPSGSQFNIAGATSGSLDWNIELELTAAELGVTDLPSIIGFGVQAEDVNSGDFATWPVNVDQTNPATTWANLKSRYPMDYAIVLDQSGSMLGASTSTSSTSKWVDAKQAANFLVNTMAILADTNYFDDRVGLVPFKWGCSGGSAADTQFEQTLTTVAPLTGNPLIGNYVTVSDPLSGNCTPIGEGLKKALQAPTNPSMNDGLDGAVATTVKERERVILLLSDGLHNRPSTTLSPTEFGYDPCPGTSLGSPCPAGTVSNVRVNAVGLGNDGTVPVDLLTNIKNRFGSQSPFTPLPRYNITTNSEQLKEIFINSLADSELYSFNLISSSLTGLTPNFTVNANEQRLIAILSWTTLTDAQDFTLQRLNGSTWEDVACDVNNSGHSDDVGYAVCTVNTPTAGTWRVNSTGLATPSSQFVLIDLNLRAKFAIDPTVHGTGRDIILTAELKKAGQPLINDPVNHPVKVTVNIEKPQEGFGEFVSTREPKTCEVRPPQLPTLPGNLLTKGGVTTFQPSSGSVLTVTASAVSPSTPDPPTPRFALAQQLFRDCDKEGLLRAEDSGLELRDDGTKGDAVAKDGIYTLRFTNTEHEGSYIFRFNAQGKTPDGHEFTRTELLAEYTRVELDPSTTTTGSRIVQQDGRQIVKEYYAIPLDRFGRHLGPGYPDQVQFLQLGFGQWLSPVVDYNNGIYSRLLRYDATQGEPIISTVIQDKPIQISKLPLPWWFWWLIILLILIILLLLILLFRNRTAPNP